MMLDYLYRDVITVFNRYPSGNSYVWFPHVLRNVHIFGSNGAQFRTYGDSATDNVSVNIRYNGDRDFPAIDEMNYYMPKRFRLLSEDEAEKSITFSYGDEFDFFIKGEWDGDRVVMDDDYADNGSFFNYMNRKYDEVYAISSCAKYDYLPHFTITGR